MKNKNKYFMLMWMKPCLKILQMVQQIYIIGDFPLVEDQDQDLSDVPPKYFTCKKISNKVCLNFFDTNQMHFTFVTPTNRLCFTQIFLFKGFLSVRSWFLGAKNKIWIKTVVKHFPLRHV